MDIEQGDVVKIFVDRGSVCMGDDAGIHKRELQLYGGETAEKLIRRLVRERFFPSVSGNDVVWVMEIGKNSSTPICAYYTKADRIDVYSPVSKLSELCSDGGLVKFTYISQPERWEEYLLKRFNGS